MEPDEVAPLGPEHVALLKPGHYDHAVVLWLARFEPQVCAAVAGMIGRARQAGPEVPGEAVTVTCSKHRRHCTLAGTPRGGGIRIRHAGPGDTELCDSQRFTVRQEQVISREGAHAWLVKLDLDTQAQAKLREDAAP